MAHPIAWHCHAFEGYTASTLYEALRLRDQVFVLEQQSIYGDLDNLDQVALHLLGRDENGRLAAYARILPPGTAYADAAAIGRVVVAPEARGQGLGRQLMEQALAACAQHHPGLPVRLSAQTSALGLYQALGFEVVSEPYDDGGIEHVEMKKPGS